MKQICHSVEINANPEKVFGAFLDARMLRDWWGAERVLIEPDINGNYALVWGISKSGFEYVTTGVISVFEPHSVLEISNFLYFNPQRKILGPTKLRIDIVDEMHGAELTITQSGFGENGEGEDWDWYYDVVDESWPRVLSNLKNYLEMITRAN